MTHHQQTWSCQPRITFQDTNVVGNVYFLTFFRWQAECRDHWLRSARPDLWQRVRSGEQRLLLRHWETRFEDSFGATIGDHVEVIISVSEGIDETITVTTEVFKQGYGGPIRIASGKMAFTTREDLIPPHNDHCAGPCYSYTATTAAQLSCSALELLGWQGKCRELFLEDHAAGILNRVANRDLILQTTTASLDMLQLPPEATDQVRIEMRLESLKCGQMGVRFDYFADRSYGLPIRFAKGSQKMSSKHQSGPAVVPCPFPADLLLALRKFTQSEKLLGKINDILCFSSAQQTEVAAMLSPVNK